MIRREKISVSRQDFELLTPVPYWCVCVCVQVIDEVKPVMRPPRHPTTQVLSIQEVMLRMDVCVCVCGRLCTAQGSPPSLKQLF